MSRKIETDDDIRALYRDGWSISQIAQKLVQQNGTPKSRELVRRVVFGE